ncbi:LPP20 family lipoprotein [Agaribacter marinus]|uniref:Lipoprotein LPP20-like domain-containing protein n=1 Tax=Agaribacter marinus TaxID=1431249 RepID=A0AA37WH24_9ALTE|nr:LPP20 family lipoprotein [Agaribacter marinus]GLR69438.1 hypothetical protein GCM10007852_03460 [Agaribacter marinus]
MTSVNVDRILPTWIIFTTLLLVCAKAFSALPDWVSNPKTSDTEYYAIGEGKSLDQARDVALKNILGQINTKVSGSSLQKQSLHNNKFSEKFVQVVTSKVEELPISGFKELKTHKEGNTHYMLVSVSKRQLVDTFSFEIDENIARSERIISTIDQAGSDLEWWFVNREELFKLLLVNDRLNNLFPFLGASVDKSSQIQSMASTLSEYAKSNCLYVASYPNKAVRSAIRDNVVNAGLVANNRKCKYQLTLTETTNYKLMFGTTHTYSIYGTLTLSENGETLTSESINEVGSSPNGEAVAKQAAFYRLAQKIKNDNQDNEILISLLEN